MLKCSRPWDMPQISIQFLSEWRKADWKLSKMTLKFILKVFIINARVESVRIRSYSGPHFPAFGLNTEIYQSKCGKMRIRITPNTDTFHAVTVIALVQNYISWNRKMMSVSWKSVVFENEAEQLCVIIMSKGIMALVAYSFHCYGIRVLWSTSQVPFNMVQGISKTLFFYEIVPFLIIFPFRNSKYRSLNVSETLRYCITWNI